MSRIPGDWVKATESLRKLPLCQEQKFTFFEEVSCKPLEVKLLTEEESKSFSSYKAIEVVHGLDEESSQNCLKILSDLLELHNPSSSILSLDWFSDLPVGGSISEIKDDPNNNPIKKDNNIQQSSYGLSDDNDEDDLYN
jgi:hypothetical protein